MDTKLISTFAATSAVLLTLLTTTSLRAGTITVVNLPTNGTDLATGITTNKHYVCAFDYGSLNSTTYSVNGVKLAHFGWATGNNNKWATTNAVDPNHPGGRVVISSTTYVDDTSSTGSGGSGAPPVASQANGNMQSVLTDIMYTGNGAPIGSWLQQEYDNLIVGNQYSLRVYYRQWSANRTQNVYFNGEGTWQAYPGNPLNEDAGGAHWIEYDFTAAATNVFCAMTNLVANGATMIYGATLEDDSTNYAPFITYEPVATTLGSSTFSFSLAAIGSSPLAYQWYFNTASNYSGATMTTDGSGISGSVTTNLTISTGLLDYYFVVVTNDYGSATSSIVQINPLPVILTQPSSTSVGNSYVLYNVAAGGPQPLAYQWYDNTVSNYSGATMTTDGNGYSGSVTTNLTATTNLQDDYFVVVTNNYGSTTSAITAYNPLPVIMAQPSPFKSGSSVGFNVTASGWPALGYQWYDNTVSNYSGATMMTDGSGVSGSATASVTVANLQDFYFVVVSNYYGSVTSVVAELAVPLTATSAGEPIWNQTSQTNVIVAFSDILDPVTATNVGNYSLDNGATVLSAMLGGSNEVVLTTSVLDPATSYTLTVQNVNDYYGITMSPTPANLAVGLYPANLALWIKANAGVTIDSGTNTVNEWDDLSGNGNNLYNTYGPESPREPLLVTNAWGDPVIRFTGTNATIMFAQTSSTLAIVGDISIIAVVNYATLDGGTNGEIVSKVDNNSIAAPYDCYVANTTSGAHLYRGNGTSYGQFTATSVPFVGAPHVLVATESGNTVSHFLDGMAAGTGFLNLSFNETSSTDAGQPLTIGERQDGANCLTGDLGELIIAGSAVSAYDVAELTTYLVQEHNIVFVNPNPTNIVFSVTGGQLTLSWPADHIGWQLQAQTNSLSVGISTNWVNIGLATTNQVTIPISTTNGSVFYRLSY